MSKTFYVTTSIPYVNAQPHIGFGLEIVQADVMARYARQRGFTTLFSTGTDEHGSKIAETAAKNNVSVNEFVDQNAASFKDLLTLLNISNDRFIRTTDKGHEQRAQVIWKKLAGDIYKGKYTGWYCVGCEEFVTETQAKERGGNCPNHQKPYEKLEEDNYFFKLSKYTKPVLELITSGKLRIVPEIRKNEIVSLLQKGLEDISVSRPKEKISWGIPVPGDANQVMYVWFEALMNYITVLGYPEHQDFATFWPATVQVVGKDILRFHAAIWPAMLMGLGIPVQQSLFVHGFLTIGGQKISKSLGNVIAPKEIVTTYGVEAFRYYFLRHVSSYEDGDFSWERLHAVYHAELANELGNAVQRVAAMITKYQDGVIGQIPAASHDIAQFEAAMQDFRFDQALNEVWEQVRGLNQYIDEEKPWTLAKNKEDEHLQEVLATAVGAIMEIAELLTPFLPSTTEKIKYVFEEGVVRMSEEVLFPRIEKTPEA